MLLSVGLVFTDPSMVMCLLSTGRHFSILWPVPISLITGVPIAWHFYSFLFALPFCCAFANILDCKLVGKKVSKNIFFHYWYLSDLEIPGLLFGISNVTVTKSEDIVLTSSASPCPSFLQLGCLFS